MKIDTMKISEIIIKEPLSFELLLYISENSITVAETIIELNEIDPKLNVVNLLNELKNIGIINTENNIVQLSNEGKYLIEKMRKRIGNVR